MIPHLHQVFLSGLVSSFPGAHNMHLWTMAV
jgi:hypothetical protein